MRLKVICLSQCSISDLGKKTPLNFEDVMWWQIMMMAGTKQAAGSNDPNL